MRKSSLERTPNIEENPARRNQRHMGAKDVIRCIPHGNASFRKIDNDAAQPKSFVLISKSTLPRSISLTPQAKERVVITLSIVCWFLCSFSTIVSVKTLLSTWKVPPMLLTLQELFFSAVTLQVLLPYTNKGIKGWPWESSHAPRISQHMDFVLASLFNSLDFLASNAGFNLAAASFVETVKASEPITTTMVALLWAVDRIRAREAWSLGVLILGVMLSTYGNATSAQPSHSIALLSVREALRTSVTVASANLAFAFRALSQKMYRKFEPVPLDDMNFLCQMLYVGAFALSGPALFLHTGLILDALVVPTSVQLQYTALSMLNILSFVIQK